MSSVFSIGLGNNFVENDKLIMTCKGAPEELLRKCSHFMTNDSCMEMTDDFASQVYDENVRMASQGLRVLGLAYKTLPLGSIKQLEQQESNQENDEFSSSNSNPSLNEVELTFVGLIGLIDPPKNGVKEAVATCQRAGIHVMMITGDHVETATAIAKQLGIFQNEVPGMVNTFHFFFFMS
jgi:Ca2+-transporting ATPase